MFGTHIIIIEKGKGGQHYICMHGTNEQGFLGRKKKASVLQSCVDIFSKIMLCNKLCFINESRHVE